MSKSCVVSVLVAAFYLAGCAAADPSGGILGGRGADGEAVAANQKTRSRCPAGEMLACEIKSPNRVSDGRYGFRNGKQKRCSCQPEDTIRNLRQANLPRDNR